MNYTLHQLHILLEVVRHESITKAAKELHMTQPAVSIQLKNFHVHKQVEESDKGMQLRYDSVTFILKPGIYPSFKDKIYLSR